MNRAEIDHPTTDVEVLRSMLATGKPVTVLDIRRSVDRAEWSIPGSLHVDAYDAVGAGDTSSIEKVQLPEAIPVVTVCRAGITARRATDALRARGFNASTLEGGMMSWSLAWNTAVPVVPDLQARVIQVRRTGKGCLSYMIGRDGEAVVIDASVGPEVYVDLARENGWRITSVVDTHVHADHLSRSRLVAEYAGATLRQPETTRLSFAFSPMRDGDVLAIGRSEIHALRTPGHTLESTCYLLDGKVLFCGDTVFLGAVGRPDLKAADASEAENRARLLYRSLHRVFELDAHIVIMPGHTSTPAAFDGVAIEAKLCGVRESVAMLDSSEDQFVSWVLARIPPTPPNHEAIVAANEQGVFPAGNPADLEAGANRCAVA